MLFVDMYLQTEGPLVMFADTYLQGFSHVVCRYAVSTNFLSDLNFSKSDLNQTPF